MVYLKLEVGEPYIDATNKLITITRREEHLVNDQPVFVGDNGKRYDECGYDLDVITPNLDGSIPIPLIEKHPEHKNHNSLFSIEMGRTYVSKSGRKVAIVQHVRESIILDTDAVVYSQIPEHYVGSNQKRYHSNGMMFQEEGEKYDPLVAEFVRSGQKDVDLLIAEGQKLKKTLQAAEASATKMGLFLNYILLRLR